MTCVAKLEFVRDVDTVYPVTHWSEFAANAVKINLMRIKMCG
jgi:hypothetical protein